MANFEDLVTVVRNLCSRTAVLGTVSGKLRVDTPDKLAALIACVSDVENSALTLLIPDNTSMVAVGSEVEVEIATPRPGFGLIPENLDALLCYPGAHIKEPAHYFLLDTNYCKDDLTPSGHIVAAYRVILGFVAMLKSCAAFLDEHEDLLIFIREGKFEVPVKFTEGDLLNANIENIITLSNVIPKDMHTEQCASIMSEAVYEITAMLPLQRRFSALIDHSEDLLKRFENGYKLFAAGFSYEKIKDEIEAARIEYSGKIHKVFSDIQNQLLGIPVATIIVATQMKENIKIDSNFWISTAVLVGSFIFMLLMHFLLQNQRDTLEVIGIEINRQKAKLEREHAAIAENFISTFTSLDTRYKTQRVILNVIDVVVAVGFLMSVFFFYKLSQPVQEWLRSLIS